jgi:hypothetical protein
MTIAVLSAGFGLAGELAMRRERIALVTALGRHDISAEIADDDAKRALGLMFRKEIGETEGMLFLYAPAEPVSMWMRNTYISLDMVFIAAGGKVVRIVERTEPLSERLIGSGGTVAAVLELKAGTAARLGLKYGDRVETPLIAP